MPKPAHVAPEYDTLLTSLNEQRALVLWKLDGVAEDAAKHSLVGSDTTLLGIVNHLAWVERWWFCDYMGRQKIEYPWSEEDPDADWHLTDADTIATVSQRYVDAVGESNEVIERAELEDTGTSGGHHRSLRWVLVHMIEETARHLGQMDILREQLDGRTGYIPRRR